MPKAFDLKPLVFSDILGRSFTLLTMGFVPLLRWTLLFWTLPSVILAVALYVLFDPYQGVREVSAFDGEAYTWYFILRTLGEMLLGFSVLAAGISYIGSRLYVGGRPGLGEVIRAIRARLGSVLGAGVLHGMLIMLITLLIFSPTIYALVQDDPFAAAGFGTLSFLVWVPAIGFYLGTFGLNQTCVMLDDASADESFGRSKTLSKGFRMRLFGLLVVVLFVFGAPGIWGLLMIPGALVGSLLAETDYVLLAEIAGLLWQSLLVPVFFTAPVVFYYDMRCRHEGYDLAVMARNFGIEEGELAWFRMNPHAGYVPGGTNTTGSKSGSGRRPAVRPQRPVQMRQPGSGVRR